jgi:hypothetical protein
MFLADIARATPNRGRMHIFCGSPLSDGCDKTTVEPGNTYSPGVWTCGISQWIECSGDFYSPDILEDAAVSWGFVPGGKPPIIESRWKAGEDLEVRSRLTHLGMEGSEGADFNDIEIRCCKATTANFYIVVKDIGPAGGRVESMRWDGCNHELLINGSLRLCVEQSAYKVEILDANGDFDSPMAILQYRIALLAGGSAHFSFKTEHGFGNRDFGESIPLLRPFSKLSVEQGFRKSQLEWQSAAPAKVFGPDGRIGQVWQRCIFHILAAMECGLPRIGAVNYPVFWLRDGVIVLRALDLIGRQDLARIGADTLSTLFFGGGFGAESDAPGEAIWALVSHAKMTRDFCWLEKVFPHIVKRVEYIELMLHADKPVRMATESRIPFYLNAPGVNILCLPAQNGVIHGRMDWHSPDFFINCWAEGGLRAAAEAATILKLPELVNNWIEEANKLSSAICSSLLPVFGSGGGHSSIIAPYPSGALPAHRSELSKQFEQWYRNNRLTDSGNRKPELLWTYFEAAQIHNAMLLGLKDLAWTCLDGMLEPEGNWDVSAYIEGLPSDNEMLPYKNGEERRGWLDAKDALGGNMPHNWTSAEMVNLIRDMFVLEEEGAVVLGRGVPKEWLKPGSVFGVKDMPTDLGIVSYTVTIGNDGSPKVDFKGGMEYKPGF